MPQAFNAEARIVVPYTVVGIPHEFRLYVRRMVTSGDDTDLRDRGGNSTPFEDTADSFVNTIGHILSPDVSFGTVLLQRLVSLMWHTIGTQASTSSVPNGTTRPASQVTLTMADSTFDKLKAVVLDTNELPPQHVPGVSSGDAAMDAFIAEFTGAFTENAPPYNMAVSRSNDYIAVNGFISANITYNRQLARRRGLA